MTEECRYVAVTEKEPREQIADNREDFMRRWFAIAISVGFATTVVRMNWVINGVPPRSDEWDQLCRLFVALIATLLSWEGYLLSIKKKRLYEFPRYFVDICLVFVYLFLLLTSKYAHYWLFLHALTFAMYIMWDSMTVFWHPEWYNAPGERFRAVYLHSFRGGREVDYGLAMTATWFGYFFWLWIMSLGEFPYETLILAIFVLIGLAGYRYNKSNFRTNAKMTYMVPFGGAVLLTLLVLGIQ